MPKIKLTKEKVAAIQALRMCTPPVGVTAIARMFGVHYASISHILRGKTKMEYPGTLDPLIIAQTLRNLANQIESGEISIN